MLFSKFFDFFQNRKPLRRTSAPTANDDPEKLSNKLQPNLSIITQTFACYCCVLFNLAPFSLLSSRFLNFFSDFFKPDVFFKQTTCCKARFNIHPFSILSSAILKKLANFLYHTPISAIRSVTSPGVIRARHAFVPSGQTRLKQGEQGSLS